MSDKFFHFGPKGRWPERPAVWQVRTRSSPVHVGQVASRLLWSGIFSFLTSWVSWVTMKSAVQIWLSQILNYLRYNFSRIVFRKFTAQKKHISKDRIKPFFTLQSVLSIGARIYRKARGQTWKWVSTSNIHGDYYPGLPGLVQTMALETEKNYRICKRFCFFCFLFLPSLPCKAWFVHWHNLFPHNDISKKH